MKLLFAEDELAMSEAVVDILTYHKYNVDAVYDGEDAYAYAMAEQYDGIILDIMMPKMDGIEVLTKLRAKGVHTPVLLLTAKSEVEHRIQGLDQGADDYLTKPFVMGELLARVRAMLRRREEYTPDVVRFENISLDRSSYILFNEQKQFPLTKLEFQFMELFILNPGIHFSSEKLLERIWGYDTDAEIGTVWVYVSYLRKKLAALEATAQITSKRNIGYALEAKKDG
ncbi:two-component system response regulator ArlR [Clostridiales Family XIII bacterium PM5-7]